MITIPYYYFTSSDTNTNTILSSILDEGEEKPLQPKVKKGSQSIFFFDPKMIDKP